MISAALPLIQEPRPTSGPSDTGRGVYQWLWAEEGGRDPADISNDAPADVNTDSDDGSSSWDAAVAQSGSTSPRSVADETTIDAEVESLFVAPNVHAPIIEPAVVAIIPPAPRNDPPVMSAAATASGTPNATWSPRVRLLANTSQDSYFDSRSL